MNKVKLTKVAMWFMIVVVVFILGYSMISKFFEHEMQVANAQNWGIPYDLMYIIGAYEIIVIRLIVRGPRHYGALALTVQMLVAGMVHLLNDEAEFSILNLALIAMAYGIYKLDKLLKSEEPEN